MEIVVNSPQGIVKYTQDAPILLSELLSLHQVPLAMPCAGQKRCMKCRVVATGHLSPLTDREKSALSPAELQGDVRLACMTTALGDCQVYVGTSPKTQVLTDAAMPNFPLNPMGKAYGVAVDIGTTTVAAYLYHLPSATQVAVASMLNPQAIYGADVISRLQLASLGQGKDLATAIRQGLQALLEDLTAQAMISPSQIDAMVITGNSAMEYLLTNHPVQSLIALPFAQDRHFGEYLPPADLDLDLPSCPAVYITPCISAYVGGDITMSSLAAELFRKTPDQAPVLLCDIGTNGEMVLVSQGKSYCCSTAAGPTFEGAGIHMGMTAKAGAISKVSFENGQFTYNIIGGGEATGICGTGIIDVMAAFLEAEIMDDTGRMEDDFHDFVEYLTEFDGKIAIRLPGTQVVVTQADIRNVQMAKSAICAGMETLLHTAGLDGSPVALNIAGGFGSFIDPVSAEKIGLIPPGFADHAKAIGNAAGAGACMVLLSQEMETAAQSYSQAVETVELSTDPFFIDHYTMGMMFPEQE